jgi:hypothetical protein
MITNLAAFVQSPQRKAAFALYLAICTVALSFSASAQEPVITTFDPPGSFQTVPVSINPAGTITGYYFEGFANHGFLRAPDGTITTFDPPGSGATLPFSINSAGAITGYYAITTFDPPGAIQTAP